MNAVLRMHIVMLVARKGVLLWGANLHPRKFSLTWLRKRPSQQKSKMNRVHSDQGTTETESSSEEYTVHNVGRHSNDPVYVQILLNGNG